MPKILLLLTSLDTALPVEHLLQHSYSFKDFSPWLHLLLTSTAEGHHFLSADHSLLIILQKSSKKVVNLKQSHPSNSSKLSWGGCEVAV